MYICSGGIIYKSSCFIACYVYFETFTEKAWEHTMIPKSVKCNIFVTPFGLTGPVVSSHKDFGFS